MYKIKSNSANFPISYIGSLYQFFFGAILPCTVLVSRSLPFAIHFIVLTVLLELCKQQNLTTLFLKNFKAFCFLNILSLSAFLSTIVSIDPVLSFKSACHLTYFINLGFIFFRGMQVTDYQKHIYKGLWIGFIIASFLGFIESQTRGLILDSLYNFSTPFHSYNRYTAVLLVLLPFILLISFKEMDLYSSFYQKRPKVYLVLEKVFKSVLLFISAVTIFKFQCDTSKLILCLDIILLILLSVSTPGFKKLIMQLLVCLCFVLPLLSTKIYNIPFVHEQVFNVIRKPSFYDRLSVWEYVQQLNLNKTPHLKTLPQQFLGFGINSSRIKTLSNSDRTWIQPDPETVSGIPYREYQSVSIPLHPHNFVLQLWLELGLAGVGIAFILLMSVINYIFEKRYKENYITSTCLSFFGLLITSSMGHGLWQTWWLCTIALSFTVSELFRRN